MTVSMLRKLFGSKSAQNAPASMPRVLYVHIPKAGGSAINSFFKRQLGPAQCEIHAEGLLRSGAPAEKSLIQKHFISAHLTLPRLRRALNSNDRFVLTVLRNPIEQTISHLAWMRYQAESSQQNAYAELPDYVQQLVGKLAEIDLSDPSAVGGFLHGMTAREMPFFDNCQTRYLTQHIGEPVNAAQLKRAKRNLQLLNLVGLAEQMQDVFDYLSWRLCLLPADGRRRVNVSRLKYGLDAADPALVEVLEPFIQYDRQLYAEAERHFARAVLEMWEEMERERPAIINRKLVKKLLGDRARLSAATES